MQALESSFAADIGDERFKPYIQLHEYEAYLFADVGWVAYFYDHHERPTAALRAIADAHDSPESIDDGQLTAPSKRIVKELPDYEGAKTAVGPQAAQLIGLNAIRGKCPHFAGWLATLERLGHS